MIDKVTVFAASSGLKVDAITEAKDNIKMIMSRFHIGQF